MDHHQTVCCMCGDVGFPDKLFRCSNCRNRFQHTYCSNYYAAAAAAAADEDPNEICDWCQCDGTRNGGDASSPSSSARKRANGARSTDSGGGDKMTTKQQGGSTSVDQVAAGKAPSPRTPTRRYKLLKDVMC